MTSTQGGLRSGSVENYKTCTTFRYKIPMHSDIGDPRNPWIASEESLFSGWYDHSISLERNPHQAAGRNEGPDNVGGRIDLASLLNSVPSPYFSLLWIPYSI